jgi:lipase
VNLHVHEWGDPGAPPVVCLHGVTGHGERFARLAQRWPFRTIAPDLRGHGRSGWDPPWTFETHVADLVETLDARGLDRPDWVGHSFGGRLVLELAAAHPERVGRVVLLDPAIDLLPHVQEYMASSERGDPVYDDAEDYRTRRQDNRSAPAEYVLEDAAQHCDVLPDGRLRRRTCQPAISEIYRELGSPAPPPETLCPPALLLHAPAFGLVRDEHLDAYRDRAELVEVPGMHMVMWEAFDETAEAVERFLEDARAER